MNVLAVASLPVTALAFILAYVRLAEGRLYGIVYLIVGLVAALVDVAALLAG